MAKFTGVKKLENATDVAAIAEVKGENPFVYATAVRKDGTEVTATGGTTIATVVMEAEDGEKYRLNVHNDVTKIGLIALQKVMEKGVLPVKYIGETRGGKGNVMVLPLKDGSGVHNTHIYLKKYKGSSGRSAKVTSTDEIDW